MQSVQSLLHQYSQRPNDTPPLFSFFIPFKSETAPNCQKSNQSKESQWRHYQYMTLIDRVHESK